MVEVSYLVWMPFSIFLNFWYLPFKQAIKMPLCIVRPNFIKLRGKVVIEATKITPGMIKLGYVCTGMYRKIGFNWENQGTLIFKGNATFRNQNSIIIGEEGILQIGNHFHSNSNNSFICYDKITFGDNCNIGWNTQFVDTDFHPLINALNGLEMKYHNPIIIGNNNWIGNSCIITKGTKTPNYITITQGSVVSGRFKCEEKSIIGGNPAKLIVEGCFYRENKN